MKNHWKRKIVIMLSLILLLSSLDVNTNIGMASTKTKTTSTLATENFSVKSTDGVGNLIGKAVTEKESEINNGNNIFSVEMREENEFVVDFETVETCTLLLAIYTEDGKKMITSSKEDVSPGERTVEILLNEVPEYFIIRAFLIDTDTNQPLCTKYESPMYTKEMQEFFDKEVGDFAEDKVLNLDDSETNNFAVYDEKTQVIDEQETINVLREADENEQRYVFDNINTKMSSLEAGDILSYEKKDKNVLIIKVHTIEFDGDTATIVGEDTSMNEVFDYVKIEGEQNLEDAQIVESKEEGIQYEGITKNAGVSTRAVDFESGESLEASVKFINKKVGGEHANAKLNGSVKLSMTTSVKVYVSLNYQYLEMKIDYKLSNEISLSGTVKGTIPLLAKVGFSPVPGVIIEFTPSFALEGSASVSIKATVKATVGFSVSPQDGFKNLTSSPKYDDITVEGKVNVFVGLSLEPKVVVISKAVAEASVEVTAGGVINGTLELYNQSSSESEKHDCKNCIEGDISIKIALSVGATFVSTLKVEYSKKYQFKITDFYYSLDSRTGGFGTCPNKRYKISVVTKNPNGNPVEGAVINNLYQTNPNGSTNIWLSDGVYTLKAAKGSIETVSKKITVSGKSKKIVITFNTNSDIQGNEDATSNPLIGKKIKSVSVNRDNCGIVTTEGDLYTWGYSWNEQLGTGLSWHKIPKKILSNVAEVQMPAKGPGAALTTNGDLYIWGVRENGSWNEKWDYGEKPTKILENVKSFKLDMEDEFYDGLACYALTKTGDLYLWGNHSAMYGVGDSNDYSKPCKVMDNVKEADIIAVERSMYRYFICCAIKNNGDLYIWSKKNFGGVLGDLGQDIFGEPLGSRIPIKRLENVKSARLSEDYCVALTNSNDLYAWGENRYGSVGNGTSDNVYEPYKVISDIISYDIANTSVAAINSKNQLFVWGGVSLTPTLLLNNIEQVNLSDDAGGAKTISGEWYMWGDAAYVGDIDSKIDKPYKCPLNNVKELDFESYTIFAITKKSDLYMWGGGCWERNQHGDWEPDVKYEPVKINGDLSSFKILTSDNNYDGYYIYSLGSTNQEQYKLSDDIGILEPDTIYNVYVVEDDEKNWLADDNLLYVNQCMSNAEGEIDLDYMIKREVDGEPYVMVCPLNKIHIKDCSINVEDIFVSGSSSLVEISVSYNGKRLVEGLDYELSGNVEVEKPGIYSLTVEGIGTYTGTIKKSFNVYCDHVYGEWVVVKESNSKAEGLKKQKCIICGNERTLSIPKSSSVKEDNISKPGRVTGLKVKNKKKQKVIVSWNKKANVSGYQIQYAYNKNLQKKKKSKMVGKKTSKKTITKLKKGKTYYVRVRAYKKKTSGGRIYGKWSKIKKIKIKK